MEHTTKHAVSDSKDANEDIETDIILRKLICLNKKRIKSLLLYCGEQVADSLEISEAVGMKSLLHLSWKSMRTMRRLFTNTDSNKKGMLPSEKKIRQFVKEKTSHLESAKLWHHSLSEDWDK